MNGILYLLGLPTPVIELVLGGVLLFLVTAIYFGLNFTGLDEVDIDQGRGGQGRNATSRVEESDG
ncbi:hypothetical protein [Natrinema halophilum]|uniref:Uncharacterized protein n=1 Tax=Natrinema halophilum TaxID=1699371 RepID=A0A7D5KJ37_9EURY|nr:hypothetical protein [Natrinema halophilum]QLG49119.1 hypothetical protein HYG82_09775 [Natrinema halophilum]